MFQRVVATLSAIALAGAQLAFPSCVEASHPGSSTASASASSPPTPVQVMDDGSVTYATTQLHAHWTSSSHPTAAIVEYQYLIQERSAGNPIIVPWTSGGLSTEMTHTGLSLQDHMSYYIGVRAQADNGLWSAVSYSDGIQVLADTTPPTGAIQIQTPGGTVKGAAPVEATHTPSVVLSLSAIDRESGMGPGAQMALSNDDLTYTTEPYAMSKTWTLPPGEGLKTVFAKFQDVAGNWSAPVSNRIILDMSPPTITAVAPLPGPTLMAGQMLTLSAAVIGAGPSLVEYQHSIGRVIVQPWSPTATYAWHTTEAMTGPQTITVEVRDAAGADAKTQTLYLYLAPPGPP